MKQLITTLAASGKPINKDPALWVKYYLENPSQLADFITIANDTARRLAAEVERLEAELAAANDEIERLRASITGITKGIREGTKMLRTENEKLRAAVFSVINWGVAEGDETKRDEIWAKLIDSVAYPYDKKSRSSTGDD